MEEVQGGRGTSIILESSKSFGNRRPVWTFGGTSATGEVVACLHSDGPVVQSNEDFT